MPKDGLVFSAYDPTGSKMVFYRRNDEVLTPDSLVTNATRITWVTNGCRHANGYNLSFWGGIRNVDHDEGCLTLRNSIHFPFGDGFTTCREMRSINVEMTADTYHAVSNERW
jgi:hypothetical protein